MGSFREQEVGCSASDCLCSNGYVRANLAETTSVFRFYLILGSTTREASAIMITQNLTNFEKICAKLTYLTFLLLNCLFLFFIRLMLELITQSQVQICRTRVRQNAIVPVAHGHYCILADPRVIFYSRSLTIG